MKKIINYIPYLVIIFLFLCGYYIIHQITKPDPLLIKNPEVQAIEDTICSLRQELKYLQDKDSTLQRQYDSLKKLPPIIKIQTIEKVKVINSSTDVNELDSIIRTNW